MLQWPDAWRVVATVVFAAGAAGATWIEAKAEEKYPSRRVTVVVPFGPGTSTDAIGRILSEKLRDDLGQPFVVENRAGAGGILGATSVARAEPDGYTLLIGGNTTHTAAPALFKSVPYDPVRDFTPLARIGKFPSVVSTNSKQPFKTIQSFVTYAKANPGKLTFGYGNSTGHVTGEMLKSRLGLDIALLPYTSNPPALTDLLGNSIQLMVTDHLNGFAQIQAGQIVPLAAVTLERNADLPGTPTLDGSVMPGFEVLPWAGVMGPAGLSPEVASKLSAAIENAMKQPDVLQRIRATGTEPYYLPHAAFVEFIKADGPRWLALTHEAGIEPR